MPWTHDELLAVPAFNAPFIYRYMDWYGNERAVIDLFEQNGSDTWKVLYGLIDMCVFPAKSPVPFVLNSCSEPKKVKMWSGATQKYRMEPMEMVREQILFKISLAVNSILEEEVDLSAAAQRSIVEFLERMGVYLEMIQPIYFANQRFGTNIKTLDFGAGTSNTREDHNARSQRLNAIMLHLYNETKETTSPINKKKTRFLKDLKTAEIAVKMDGFLAHLAANDDDVADLFEEYRKTVNEDDEDAFDSKRMFGQHIRKYNVFSAPSDAADKRKVFVVSGQTHNKSNVYSVDREKLERFMAGKDVDVRPRWQSRPNVVSQYMLDKNRKIAAKVSNVFREIYMDAREEPDNFDAMSQATHVLLAAFSNVSYNMKDIFVEVLKDVLEKTAGIVIGYEKIDNRLYRIVKMGPRAV